MSEGRVRVTWWLHACFELQFGGRSLLIDPHDGGSLGVGFQPPRTSPDYVLVTHDHYDHNAVEVVASETTMVVRERTGAFELPPFRVKGVKLPHDEFEGRMRGFVVAYRVEVGGLALVHLSDLGRPLKAGELEELKPVDVAFVPAGNVYTLHPRQALEVAEQLGAKIAVPMHYWLPGMQLPLEPLDTILRYAKRWRVVRHDTNSFELSREDVPDEPTILVLQPPRGRS
jgi:L-ascorbate metabolism protein UlaG (beta-lactamase superfamily)